MADAILMVVAITVLESHTYISPVRETAEEQLVFFSRAWSRLLIKLRRLPFARQKQFHILDFHSKPSHFDTFAFQLIPTTNDWEAIEVKTGWLRQGSILRNTQLRWVLVEHTMNLSKTGWRRSAAQDGLLIWTQKTRYLEIGKCSKIMANGMVENNKQRSPV